jgi:hypothetical protein
MEVTVGMSVSKTAVFELNSTNWHVARSASQADLSSITPKQAGRGLLVQQ